MSEKLNINTTPPTLFVGVGGIGSEIVSKVAKHCKPGEAKNIRFVVMDTNVNDLDDIVRESKGLVTAIQTSSTQTVKDYLSTDKDAKENWFPNNTTIYSKSVSEGAGQVRAISRLALNATVKNGKIQGLYKAIDELFLKDGGDLKQALRVVVVSSVAGGTGSGIVTPISMMIRNYLFNHYREKAAIIRGYLLLPGILDVVISSETEKESLRRNSYAALKEINAFMIKASGFCEVRKELERYKDLHIDIPLPTGGVQRLDNLPFDFVFLLDRIDERQESMPDPEHYKEYAAQSLYEQHIGPMQKKAFSQDDNIIKEFSNHDNLGRNRFGGIGSSALIYPYESIADYIAFGRAIERIGDGEAAGEWMKYDEKFKAAMDEYKKKRTTSNEDEPKIEEVYVSAVNNDESRFGIDIKRQITSDVEKIQTSVNKNLEKYINVFVKEVIDSLLKVPGFQPTALESISSSDEYEEDSDSGNDSKAYADILGEIRGYEFRTEHEAASIAKTRAKAILFDSPSITHDVKPYHLENLFKSHDGGLHPNAVRYLLYALKTKAKLHHEKSKKNDVDFAAQQLRMYAQNAHEDDFDFRKSKKIEKSIDDLVALVSEDESKIKAFFSKKAELLKTVEEHLGTYAERVAVYRDEIVREAALSVLIEYLGLVIRSYEEFYESFVSKVYDLRVKQEEIVDSLVFKNGNSIRYVCATKNHLDRMYSLCPEGSAGLMLPEKLNAKIFDAIKKNAESTRLLTYDPSGDYPKTDIFDQVLIDYFRQSVREDCAEVIDLNIIKALSTEQKFNEFFKANSLRQDGEKVIIPKIESESKDAYLKSSIKKGHQLAAPGISASNFEEERKIQACAYNLALDSSRAINMHELLETMSLAPVASDTVSKYELRFFNALYNITIDKLSRFKAPEDMMEEEKTMDQAGIYYRAYRKHSRKIGPDSTKSASISLHIDKRWDSLTELPEISLKSHYSEMVKIHSALVYGIVHGVIRTHESSTYDQKKRIYKLEDLEGELTKFIVSNKSECDEFYEVLDALYRDMASVAKIYEMAEERRSHDVQSNCRYENTNFAKDVNTFVIGDGKKHLTSLFEIPLMYYNSLPRAKMDDNELAIMVDSVIDILINEVTRYERPEDVKPYLAKKLVEQYYLLINNFNDDVLNENEYMRKNTTARENIVLNVVCRKVSKHLKKLQTSGYEDTIRQMRDALK